MPLTADGVAPASWPPPLKIWTPRAADLARDLPTYAHLFTHYLCSLAWRNRKRGSDCSASERCPSSVPKAPNPDALCVGECEYFSLARYPDMWAHFNWHWKRRHPVVVRDIQPGVSWRPLVMESAMKDTETSSSHKDWLQVVDCQDGGMGDQLEMAHEDFFQCVIPARAIPVSVHAHPRESVREASKGSIHLRVDAFGVPVLIKKSFGRTRAPSEAPQYQDIISAMWWCCCWVP